MRAIPPSRSDTGWKTDGVQLRNSRSFVPTVVAPFGGPERIGWSARFEVARAQVPDLSHVPRESLLQFDFVGIHLFDKGGKVLWSAP